MWYRSPASAGSFAGSEGRRLRSCSAHGRGASAPRPSQSLLNIQKSAAMLAVPAASEKAALSPRKARRSSYMPMPARTAVISYVPKVYTTVSSASSTSFSVTQISWQPLPVCPAACRAYFRPMAQVSIGFPWSRGPQAGPMGPEGHSEFRVRPAADGLGKGRRQACPSPGGP